MYIYITLVNWWMPIVGPFIRAFFFLLAYNGDGMISFMLLISN
jgi:hypothetical protein